MKIFARVYLTYCFVLLMPVFVNAQTPAPNRAAEVRAIVADHASKFPAANDEVKEKMLAVIAQRLNQKD